MAILDTLYLVFKGDTTNLKVGLQDAKQRANQLNSHLQKTDILTSKVGSEFSKLLKMTIGIGAFIGATRSVFEYANNLTAASESLSVNIQSLGAWSAAAKQAGGTAEGFQQSIKNMSEKLNVSPSDAFNKLPKISDDLKNLSFSSAMKVGKEMGLDEKTIELLRKGNKELSEIIKKQKELGIITEKDAKIIKDFNFVLGDTVSSFKGFGSAVLGDVLPYVSDFFGFLRDGMAYAQRYPNLIESITVALVSLGAVISAKLAIPFLLSPIARLIAAIAGIGAVFSLVYDDIKVFVNGGESLIGGLVEKFEWLGDSIEVIKDVINDLSNVWDSFIGKSEKGITESIFDIGRNAKWKEGTIFDMNHSPKKRRDDYDSALLSESFNKTSNEIFGFMGDLLRPIREALTNATPSLHQSASSESYNSPSFQNNITVYTTATDGNQIGQEINSAIENAQFRQANSNFDDGVSK